ncbi:hypothetical protein CEE45_10990 [Candidatus Heimdallarchaeota archaeon B3_Heim]|nr:MAG: hypothetical protein CEE45_10990 [Candidatus Heimdallarchaeota archaeon B3_Heim]
MASRLLQLRNKTRLRRQTGELPVEEEEESDVAVDGDVAAQFFKRRRVVGQTSPTTILMPVFPPTRESIDARKVLVQARIQGIVDKFMPVEQTATLTGQRNRLGQRRLRRIYPEQYRWS